MAQPADLNGLQALAVGQFKPGVQKVLHKFEAFKKDLGFDLNESAQQYLEHLIIKVLKKEIESQGADFFYKGRPLEIKHTIHDNWMIAQENVGRGAILIRTDLAAETFSVGYLELIGENLNKGQNRDTKVSVSAVGKERIQWWLTNVPY